MSAEKNYLYNSKWSNEFLAEYYRPHLSETDPFITMVGQGTMLPAIPDRSTIWGLGGVLDADGLFVKASGLDNVFGGFYQSMEAPVYLDEDILYLGIVPKHWGHLLIDVLCKLWCVNDYPNLRIAFCGLDWEKELTGNYAELLRLAGAGKERLLFIDKPYKARNILIPSRTLGYLEDYHPAYLKTVEIILETVLIEALKQGLTPIDHIYVSRTKLKSAKWNETGEIRLEKIFRDNGYTVLYPEQLSAVQQIYYYHSAKSIVCVSGTIPHNIVFASEDCRITILNRTCVINPPQIRIDQLTGADCVYVDAFHPWTLRHPRTYGGLTHYPVWLTINENVKAYCKDNYLEVGAGRFRQALDRCVIDNFRFCLLLIRHGIKIFLVKTGLYKK